MGIGGVVIEEGRALLIRRGSEPLLGHWSIPGGTLEIGESLQQGVARELFEETGLEVRVLDVIEVFDRIFLAKNPLPARLAPAARFHYVIVDYLCERISGEARAGSDVTDVAFAREDELDQFSLDGNRHTHFAQSFRHGSRTAQSATGLIVADSYSRLRLSQCCRWNSSTTACIRHCRFFRSANRRQWFRWPLPADRWRCGRMMCGR